MASGSDAASTFINTLVGEGSSLRGELAVQGFFRVDGDFSGRVQTRGRILISATGRAKGTLEGRDVVIAGLFKGDIAAEARVILLSSALVIGTIYSPRIQVEEGAILEGYCCITPRIREEGVHPLQVQNSFTLQIDKEVRVSSPLSHL